MSQFMWFCPVCGVSHGMRATHKIKYIIRAKAPYLETIDFDPDKPFGVYLEAKGYGKGKDVAGYAQPDDEPEEFARVKGRFIDAVGEWIRKGWMTWEELKGE